MIKDLALWTHEGQVEPYRRGWLHVLQVIILAGVLVLLLLATFITKPNIADGKVT